MDITKLSENLIITNQYHPISSGYTMGFWFYSNTDNLSTNLFKIVYEDHFMMTISTDTELYGYCFTGLEHAKIDASLTSKEKLSIFLLGEDRLNINYLKTSKIIKQKWNYVKCAYSNTNMKMYVDVNYETFSNMNLETRNMNGAPYFAGSSVYPPPRKTVQNPRLTITRLTGLIGVSVFIRNFVLFADYIPSSIYFQYL